MHLPMQKDHSDSSWEAQHPWFWDLVAMSARSPVPTQPVQSPDSAIQSDSAQESSNLNLHARLLEPQLSYQGARLL